MPSKGVIRVTTHVLKSVHGGAKGCYILFGFKKLVCRKIILQIRFFLDFEKRLFGL